MTKKKSPFQLLGIGEPICKAIDDMGFEAPTKIQSAAIPKILEGKDLAGQAQTGTGKTAAFAIPILENIDLKSGAVQALVMCPTRELAVQITGEFIKLGTYLKGLQVTPVYGGQPISRQIRHLENGSQIVVGTPGRLIDHLKRKTLMLDRLKMVVLDEADEMLNMGFRDDIETILSYTPTDSNKQTVMFSATMSPAIKKIMQKWFQDPEMIRVEGQAGTADGIEQYLLEVRDSVRSEGICRLLDIHNYRLGLVFCNTKRACDSLVEEMCSRGYASKALHGDMSQPMRDKVMNEFRKGRIELLIATDVAARGLDVEDVEVVFNYDIPQDPEYYVHRIGRTGRAGKKGVAYSFSSGRKSKNIRYIEKQLNMKLQTIPLPSVSDVQSSRMDTLMEKIVELLESGGLRPYIERVEALSAEKFTPIEVAAALLKMRESQEKPVQEITKKPRTEKKSRKPGKSGRGKGDKRSKPEPFYTPFVRNSEKKGTRKRSRKKG